MTAYVALLRAVNVGGTGKLPMSDLKEMCEALGFTGVRTYIASGNVVFSSRKSESAVKKALETQLETYAGKPVGVLVRTAAEMPRPCWRIIHFQRPRPTARFSNAPPADTLASFAASATNKSGWGAADLRHYGQEWARKLVICRQADGPAGVGVPVRRAQPGEGRHQEDAAGVRDGRGERLDLGRARMIPSPSRSHCTAAPAMKTLPSSAYSVRAAEPPGDGGEQPVRETTGLVARVHAA